MCDKTPRKATMASEDSEKLRKSDDGARKGTTSRVTTEDSGRMERPTKGGTK
jgi:hypothetical protein